MYDYLIIGSGLFGSVFAREMKNYGKSILVIDKRSHIGGNCYTENIEGINIHKYGPHIFHTSNKEIWEYVNRLVEFNNFKYRPKVNYKGNIYSFPINLLTLYQIYNVKTPSDAIKLFDANKIHIENLTNLEDWCLSNIGEELYNIFIRGYTKKQWGCDPRELPTSIIKRIPIRFNFDDSYYFDRYEGIPIGGYTQIFEKLLDGIEVRLNQDYFSNRDYFDSIADKIVYTGAIDRFYDYKFGKLDYRSLDFKTETLDIMDFQGTAGINYTEYEIPYTRIIEHKHFEFGNQSHTIITKEYPTLNGDPYYPINNQTNNQKYNKYKDLMNNETNFIFGGRLADYKYYDMHQVIGSSLHRSKKEFETFK
jgi:UDP-galactopyranose mutase